MSEFKLYTYDNEFIGEVDTVPDNFTGIAIYFNGSKHWYLNGAPHRLDGPAIEYINGSKLWYINSKRHRIDGPAREWVDREKEWWVDDKKVSEQEHNLLYNIMKLKGLL